MIPNRVYVIALLLVCSLYYVWMSCLINFNACLFGMQHDIQLLVEPDSLRFETVWFIIFEPKPVITRHWCLAPEHDLVRLKAMLMHKVWHCKQKSKMANKLASLASAH